MHDLFHNIPWIWYTDQAIADSYGDFMDSFSYTEGKVICHLSCDGDYTLYVNGKYASSKQYGDFEHYKIYDSIDITDYLVNGENSIHILVWHLGVPSSKSKPAKAGLIYKVECNGSTLCESGEHTRSRENPNFKSGYQKKVTNQLGQSFLFDATKSPDTPFGNSVLVNKACQMYPLPIKKLDLLPEKNVTVLKDEGNHYLLDLGAETIGFPVLRFSSPVSQTVTVAWGEHILDGGVRRRIKTRDFSFEYVATPGENSYTNYMMRLGCRYLEVFCEAPIQMEYIGLLPQAYPVNRLSKTFDDPMDQKIYDLCVDTLQLCMAEHYMDTPWREQSLYVFDARNQILCGYAAYADGNRDYARANLLLIGKDRREDDLLSITYPSGSKLAIPSFSLHYFTAIREYLDYTGDLSLAEAVYDKLLTIIQKFRQQIVDGLLVSFYDSVYWNFYDWTPSMDEPIGSTASRPDLMINCLFVTALENLKEISVRLGKGFSDQSLIDELKENIRAHFYDPAEGLYSMLAGSGQFTELGNSLVVLAGISSPEENKQIAKRLADGDLEECTLSMKCFKYDALLKIDANYRQAIVAEIRRTYATMLEQGATSVWEVIGGADAFSLSGSLCHAWSSTPTLYL